MAFVLSRRFAHIFVVAFLLAAPARHLAGAFGSRSHRVGRRIRSSSPPVPEAPLKARCPFYHSSEELRAETRRLVGSCRGADASLKTVEKDGVSLDVVSVRGKRAQPVNRAFMVFGEHSRELITTETGLVFLKALCGEETLGEGRSSDKVLSGTEFQLVLNANPRSREKVEEGEFCLRMAPSGVDLNRNWDSGWVNHSAVNDQVPGARPFSEPETQLLRDCLQEYKPTSYLSIHSGNLGLYMPWAYDMEHLAVRNAKPMMDLLRQVDEEHCHCPYGAAGKEVGYPAPGTSIDWAYDKLSVPFSFAFEIFLQSSELGPLRERWQQEKAAGDPSGMSLLEVDAHPTPHQLREVAKAFPSDFMQVSTSPSAQMTSGECLARFNPVTKEEYDETTRKWAGVFGEIAENIAKDLSSRTSEPQ